MKRDCLKEELIELLLHSDAEVDRLGLQVSDLKKRNEVLETQSEYISLLKCRTQLKVAEDRIYELEKEQSEVKEENQVMRNQIEKLTVNQSDWLTYKTLTQKQKHLIEKMGSSPL